MSGTTYQYDPKDVTILVGGKIATGLVDGTFINISYESDLYSDKSGADGDVIRNKSNDLRADITLSVLQSSSLNDYLSLRAQLDQSEGSGSFTFFLKDNNGRTVSKALTCWIKKIPDLGYAKEDTDREWILRASKLESFIGGNTPISG